MKLDDQISEAEEKLKQLRARQLQLSARKRSAESSKRRAADTRKKILIGTAILATVGQGKLPAEVLLRLLEQHLTRDADRALFGLSPRPPKASRSA